MKKKKKWFYRLVGIIIFLCLIYIALSFWIFHVIQKEQPKVDQQKINQMIEYIMPQLNYQDNMKLMEDMLKTVIQKVFGSLQVKIGDKTIDFSKKWEQVSFRDVLLKYVDIDILEFNDKEKLLNEIKRRGITLDTDADLDTIGYGNLIDVLYKKVARPYMIEPVFLTEHPIALSPLARANDENKEITDRFQLVINGAEIINGYSELVDPQEQERRLEEQARLKSDGDEEAMMMDMDYIEAMEVGMPPISGWGIGIDRVIQVLTDTPNIKDNVLFPLMRPEDK